MASLDEMRQELRERFENLKNTEFERKIQDFVDQVCAKEDWEIPKVEIPSKEAWYRLALQTHGGHPPPEDVKGICIPTEGKIFLNSKFAKYRTNILHELVHFNTTKAEIKELIEDPIIIARPELFHMRLESRAEAKARKLARKYSDEWRKKVEEK